jgi:hypothetical protein
MDDRTLERYAVIAARVHALLADPEPDSLRAPPDVHQMIAVAAYRLGLYVSAMPGAQAAGRTEFDETRLLHEELDGAVGR